MQVRLYLAQAAGLLLDSNSQTKQAQHAEAGVKVRGARASEQRPPAVTAGRLIMTRTGAKLRV